MSTPSLAAGARIEVRDVEWCKITINQVIEAASERFRGHLPKSHLPKSHLPVTVSEIVEAGYRSLLGRSQALCYR